MKELLINILKHFNLPVDDNTVEPYWLDNNQLSITTTITPFSHSHRYTVATLQHSPNHYVVRIGSEIICQTTVLNIALTEMATAYFKYICLGQITIERKKLENANNP